MGDHVKVIRGRYEGDTGLIVRVEDNIVVLFSDLTMHEVSCRGAQWGFWGVGFYLDRQGEVWQVRMQVDMLLGFSTEISECLHRAHEMVRDEVGVISMLVILSEFVFKVNH